jgi:hypothetical protein
LGQDPFLAVAQQRAWYLVITSCSLSSLFPLQCIGCIRANTIAFFKKDFYITIF